VDDSRFRGQLAFLVELDKLKLVLRRTMVIGESRRENSAEHSWHLGVMAMLLSEYAPGHVDLERALTMLLIHDVVEIDAGDTFVFDDAAMADKEERERRAADRLFGLLPPDQAERLRGLWNEFEACATPEARFAVALDRFHALLQNVHNRGGTWKRHGVGREQVLSRMGPIRDGAPALWPYVVRTVDEVMQEASATTRTRTRSAPPGPSAVLTTVRFVTIGQTPRTDMVPDLVARLPGGTVIREVGALDGLDAEAVAALAPGPGDARLVTRMADGSQAVVGKARMQEHLQEILDGLGRDPDAVTVLLCTGAFPGLRGPGIFLDAQHLVDHGVAALCAGMERIGLLLPAAEQAEEFHWKPAPHQELRATWASPYAGDRFDEAARELSGCDVIVMHCMGFTEEQRRRVARASGRPVLLARRFVAAAVAQLL
jgi:putative hydrolase of HD superfamily